MIRVLFASLALILPLFANAAAKATKTSASVAAKRIDPLELKREDLIEGEDQGWFPEMKAAPEDFYEEMELPKHAESEDETKHS